MADKIGASFGVQDQSWPNEGNIQLLATGSPVIKGEVLVQKIDDELRPVKKPEDENEPEAAAS